MKTTSKLVIGTIAGTINFLSTKSQAPGATVTTMANTELKVLNGVWDHAKLANVLPTTKSTALSLHAKLNQAVHHVTTKKLSLNTLEKLTISVVTYGNAQKVVMVPNANQSNAQICQKLML
jgi:hypothetical protein